MKKEKSPSKNKKKDEIKTIEYPRKDLKILVPKLKKIVEDYGEIVNRSQLARLFGVRETGGGFSHIVYSLKLYNVIDKEGQSDFRINDLGRGVAKEDKMSVLNSLRSIPIFKDLMERYTKLPKNRIVVREYIQGEYKIEKNTADTIARRFIKNMRFLNSIAGEVKTLRTEPKISGKEVKPKEFSTYKEIVNLYMDFKLKKIDKYEQAIERIKDIDIPMIKGKELINKIEETEADKEEKKKILQLILEIIIKSYD